MTQLVACLSTGKGSWAHVARLIRNADWDHVFLITNTFGKDKFTPDERTTLIVVDTDAPVESLRDSIHAALKEKITDIEVAVNLYSGSGREHMALICALQRLGLGFRVVSMEQEELQIL